MSGFSPNAQLEVQHLAYITVGCLSVILWDTATNIRLDYLRLTATRLSIPTVSYLLVRLCTVGLFLSQSIFLTASVPNCALLARIVTHLFAIYGPSLHLLLFCRLRAVYLNKPWIVRIFFAMWLLILGLHLGLAPLLVKADHIPGTSYCYYTEVHLKYGRALLIVVTVNANAIALAVAFRLLTMFSFDNGDESDSEASMYSRFKKLTQHLTGANLPTFSKALYEDGQFHYL
ncbi:hypothetical protein V5O48_009671 [Marasmius crinis-equi]|uniref:Integral membrane protein n=1 Tax=Marasmius crinis-equi TaxID=585013 RepID=A0ABR3FAT6_9AGAR